MAAIHSCTRVLDNSNQTSFDEDGIGSLAHTDKYSIVVTEPGVDAEWVRRNAPLPQFGSRRSFDSPLVSTGEWNIRQISPIMFEADVPFEAKFTDVTPGQGPQPSKRTRPPLQLEITSQETDDAISSDKDGNALANLNGEQFDPPLTAPISDLVITITRAVDTFDIPTVANNRNKVNSAYWYGIPRGMAKIANYDGSYHVDEEGVPYWVQTVRIIVRGHNPLVPDEKVWYRRVLHEGYKVRVVCNQNDVGALQQLNRNGNFGEGTYYRVVQAKVSASDDGKTTGELSPRPVMLDERGYRVAKDDPQKAFWGFARIYDETDFNSLPIL